MKPIMWLLLSGVLAGGAALPVNAAPLGSHGLKITDDGSGLTLVGDGYYRHRGHGHYPHRSRRYYRYYDVPYDPYYENDAYNGGFDYVPTYTRLYYYHPYYYRHYGPGVYFGGHRRWRGHW